MAVLLSPYGGVGAQFLDNSGNVLTGGKIFTYAAGTTTPQVAYGDSTGATPLSNPIILNAAGRVPTGEIWLTDGLVYKFVLTDSNDVLIATYDNIIGINSNFVNFSNEQEIQTATAGQTVFTLATMAYQPATNSLSVFVDGVNQYGPGAQYAYVETDSTTITFTSGLHVGAQVKFTTSNIVSSAGGDAFNVSYQPPFTGSTGTNVGAKLAQTVSVKDFGAVGDGITDDTAAISAAFNYAQTQLNPTIYFPTGTYSVTSSATTQFEIIEGMEIYGDGMDASIIKWTAQNPGTTIQLFGRPSSSARINSATMRDLAIRGDHDISGYISNSSYPILIYQCDSLRIHRVKVTYSRIMAIVVRASFSVDIDGCVVQYCARDGINTADCNFVKINNNRIEYIDDDAIAGHTDIANVADRNYVISGNIIRFAQGIKVLGQRSTTIVGNTLEYCFGQGISLQSVQQTPTSKEGITAIMGVTITGNTIKNNFDRAFIDNLNQNAPYISLLSNSAKAGSLPVIPGNPDPTTGLINSPYPYYYTTNNGSTTQPISNGANVIISSNIFVRDMYPTANISDYGFGCFYTRNGPVDPPVTEQAYLENGILFNGPLINCDITNNVFSGISSALSLGSTAKTVNCNFNHNIVYDCTRGIVADGGNTKYQDLNIVNNLFDLDPYFTNSNRGANNTFLTLGAPTAVTVQNSFGFSLSGNIFKNLCRIADIDISSVTPLQTKKIAILNNNYIECQPVTTGFNINNKGIGSVPFGSKFILTVVDSDPQSSTYGDVLNFCLTQADNVPTLGTYIIGHMVLQNTPTILGTPGNQYVITGWLRITNGASHLLNTDWVEMRALTGT